MDEGLSLNCIRVKLAGIAFLLSLKQVSSFAADYMGFVYFLFDKHYIPRRYLINRDGNIVFTSLKQNTAEFTSLGKILETRWEYNAIFCLTATNDH